MTSPRRDAVSGAVGGLAGGAVMTLLITQIAPRVAPQGMLPATPAPVKAVRQAERASDHRGALSGEAEQAAGLVAHALFSAAGGAAYGLARGRLAAAAALPAPVAGVVFGLAVWAAAFEGALPALGVMRRTTDHELERWPAPLVGHSLFGLVCALVTDKMRRHLTR
jgi:uncharacterized membrane protein YagU involved in acid resistance